MHEEVPVMCNVLLAVQKYLPEKSDMDTMTQ